MSTKALSLGRVGSAANGITISSGTNATPIVATVGAGHGLKNGDRIVITGVTGLTNMNGEWELSAVGATSATLLGSVGNGAFGGAAVVAVLCDRTPQMKGHAATVLINCSGTGITVAPIATVLIEGSDDNVSFASVLKDPVGMFAVTAPQSKSYEVDLKKYMRLRASAWTSGLIDAQIIA